MRTVAQLITAARLVSRNVANQDGSYSIPDSEVIQYLNDAQTTMQNKLSSTKNIAKIFVTDITIAVTAVAEYSIPDRVLLNKQIENVEFSATGNTSDFCRLEKVNFFQRDTYPTTYPSGYYKRGNQIVLQPTPSAAQGSIRVMYERMVDDMASVADTVNGTPSGSSIIVTTGYTFVPGNRICIIGDGGVVLYRNGLVSAYNAGTKTITTSGTVAANLVGTAALADLASGSITIGLYSTNISQLPDACEPYLVHSSAAEIFGKDSSNDYTRQKNKSDVILKDIIDTFKAQTGEIQFTPQMQRYEWW